MHAAREGRASLLGTLNLIHSNQIQLIGNIEKSYLNSLDKEKYQSTLTWLFSQDTVLIILLEGVKLGQEFESMANSHAVALVSTDITSYDAATELRYIISRQMADKTTLHGVFMEVAGMGLLLTGESAVGKSELALELISRGHRLVADDAPEFSRFSPHTLRGRCPSMLQDFLEVRGLGILNIRQMFGDNAIKPNKNLRLIVHMMPWNAENPLEHDRLDDGYGQKKILGVKVARVQIPVAPGRNLAVLVEAAARNHLLREHGYNSSKDLQNKLTQKLD